MSQSQGSFFDGGPKTMFLSGLFLGVAVSAVIGFILAFSLVAGGKLPTGGSVAGNVPTVPTVNDPTQAPVAAGPVKPVDEKVDHIKGSKNAKVTLIEYADFECPFCSRHLPSLDSALADFPEDVRLVYRHYPLSAIHPEAQKAAEASECAAKLGGNDKFWAMHDMLFAKQQTLGTQTYLDSAKAIGVDEAKFKACLDSGEMAARVNADASEGANAGVEGTPATFVNGQLISGAVPYAQLKAAIQAAGASK
ncbi:MAG TPA: DsbA family protein [bacterium]|nr:DsbA family protein [bacterium]